MADRVWSIGRYSATVMRLMRHASLISQDLMGLGFGTASLEGWPAERQCWPAVAADNFPDYPLADVRQCPPGTGWTWGGIGSPHGWRGCNMDPGGVLEIGDSAGPT